jgi:Rieske Fe-S protein
VRGLAVAGVGVPLLAACSGDEPGSATDTDATDAEGSGESGAAGESAGAGEPGTTLAATGDVPVGGGTVLGDQRVVVTQPTEGEFAAFSAVCTHQGCVVSGVTETIDCRCHGSQFSITDGSVTTGPATEPLAEVPITVEGDSIVLA